jgi:hypothetical protein
MPAKCHIRVLFAFGKLRALQTNSCRFRLALWMFLAEPFQNPERVVGSLHCRSCALRLRDLARCAYMGRPQSIQSRDVVVGLWSDRRIFHRLTVYGTPATLAAVLNLEGAVLNYFA